MFHIIKFKIPEESQELEITMMAPKMHSFLHEFSEWLRRKYKHTSPKSEGSTNEYEEIRAKFFEMLTEHDVKLE